MPPKNSKPVKVSTTIKHSSSKSVTSTVATCAMYCKNGSPCTNTVASGNRKFCNIHS